MAASPFPNTLGLPGSEVFGFLAGACVMRRNAFVEVGGYHPRLFLGGEEWLVAVDLMTAGWHMGYAPDVVVHHHPSATRDTPGRRRLLMRNALWCALLRRPLKSALTATAHELRASASRREAFAASIAAISGLPWVLRDRRVVPERVERALAMREALDAASAKCNAPDPSESLLRGL